jgi:hypothetical protein
LYHRLRHGVRQAGIPKSIREKPKNTPDGIKTIAEDSHRIGLMPPAEVEAFLQRPETFLKNRKNNDQAAGGCRRYDQNRLALTFFDNPLPRIRRSLSLTLYNPSFSLI